MTYKFDPALRDRLRGRDPEQFRKDTLALRERLGRLTCPVLLVRGEHSDILFAGGGGGTPSPRCRTRRS
ncbi:MAG: hypothetical protein U0531_21380 [Dehalococcoidia bacterium]